MSHNVSTVCRAPMSNTENITLRCDKLCRIDEGIGRKQRRVVNTAEDDRYGIELQGVVGLLCDVVSADGVFKTDVKPDGRAKKNY